MLNLSVRVHSSLCSSTVSSWSVSSQKCVKVKSDTMRLPQFESVAMVAVGAEVAPDTPIVGDEVGPCCVCEAEGAE